MRRASFHPASGSDVRHVDSYAVYVVAAALVVRVAGILAFPEGRWDDALQYDAIARNLVAGHGFSLAFEPPYLPTMYREPLYPLFLAFAYWLPGPDVLLAKVLQVLLSAVTCGLTYWFASLSGARTSLAVMAGLFAALHPALALYSGYILSETLVTFFLTASLVLFTLGWRRQRRRDFALAGFTMALAGLTRGAFVLLPLALAALYLVATLAGLGRRNGPGVDRRLPLVQAGCFLAAFACTIAPWSVRNQILFDSPAVTVRSGEIMWTRGHSLHRPEAEVGPLMYRHFDALRAQGLSEPDADSQMRREGVALISQEPLRYLKGNFTQAYRLWFCSSTTTMLGGEATTCSGVLSCLTSTLRGAMAPVLFVILVLIAVGTLRSLRALGPFWIPVVAVCYLTVIHSFLAFGGCRFTLPVLPCAMLLLALGTDTLWSTARLMRQRGRATRRRAA